MSIVPAIVYGLAAVLVLVIAYNAASYLLAGREAYIAHTHHRDADPANLQLDALRAAALALHAIGLLLTAFFVAGVGLTLGLIASLLFH